MGFKPNWNAHWAPTIGEMHERGLKAYVSCSICKAQKEIDLAALIEKVGPDLCLKNRRNKPCKMKSGCLGYNYFCHNRSGVILPFRDQATSDRWMLEAIGERNERLATISSPHKSPAKTD